MNLNAGTLKQYEREIARARARVDIADLDNEIDTRILALIGKLTKAQHKEYQAARLTNLMGATPEAIIIRRAVLLQEGTKLLSAPDVLTLEESLELVAIMQEIVEWLRLCQAKGFTSVEFGALVSRANKEANAAAARFYALYGTFPNLDDIPESIMRLPRARALKKRAQNSIIP